ncbi:toll/interleukin-1 receptor domain-containing protein [Leptospira santarosai]|uniref:TIR domain protein n=1 Tax=Leptospira santarosai str. ZUN179 TaxID=1049985 RepID=M6UUT2_9LEPT|nr:toll/interleukin-1 receptor domain-containing protein [Leptospira santarosai]EMO46501.1 TIR domain protein [Leptospira santarosai str. ZUN179]
MSYIAPLAVYIVWHSDFSLGLKIAHHFYSTLCRNSDKPLIRTLGIPVYFRYKNTDGQQYPLNINFKESEYTAIVPLISSEFVIDKYLPTYLDNLLTDCNLEKDKRRIFPVALSEHAFKVTDNFASINFIRIDEGKIASKEEKSKAIYEQIKSSILHELCRLLMGMKKATEETETLFFTQPVKLFISHSKHDDSKNKAIKFRNFINAETQLKTFFDANDIAFGSDFGMEIKKAAKESALVVFQSDSYSDREWCRVEVLTAKAEACPIVIVNAIQDGEKRVFPYLGNCPSIRFKGNFQAIIDLTLEQILYRLFTKKNLHSLIEFYKIEPDRILDTAPELYNFVQLRKLELKNNRAYALVIYPDPPLGSEEMDMLNELDNDFVFITPILLPSIVF